MPDSPANPGADTAALPDDSASDGPATDLVAEELDEDPVKKQFREALARKQGNPSGAAGGKGGSGQQMGHNGSAHAQRLFRRKSGG